MQSAVGIIPKHNATALRKEIDELEQLVEKELNLNLKK